MSEENKEDREMSECEYSVNTRQFDKTLRRPLKLTSTRSNEDEDAHRDMDGFSVNEELARLRRAVKEVESVKPERELRLHRFIAEAFANIDEHLRRLGQLPEAWDNES